MQPIAPYLFETEPVPRLIGGRHRTSGRHIFPFPAGQEAEAFDPVALSPNGTLWSFTVQRFRPKSPPYAGPADFAPYAVGYVELPGELIVEGRLTGLPLEDWIIGMPVRTTIVPFDRDDGDAVATYAFAPAEAAA